MRWRPLLFASVLALAGCPSGGQAKATAAPVLPQEYDPVAPCLVDALQGTTDVLARMSEAFLAIRNPALSPIATNFGDPTEWIFQTEDLAGSATFSSDPSGGMKVGDSVVVVWDYEKGEISGDGTFTIRLLSETEASLHGDGELYRMVGCAFDIAIAPAEPLTIDLTRFGNLTQGTSGPPFVGQFTLDITFGNASFFATIVVDAAGVHVRNAVINGVALPPVTIPWATFITLPPPPPSPPPPGSAVTATWGGTWTLWYRCVLFGNPLFDGTATVDIAHVPGASTFTGTETEGLSVLPLQVVSLSGHTAVVRIEYVYQQDPLDRSKDVDVIEEQTWTWFGAGDPRLPSDIPPAPERFCKLSKVILKGSNPPQVLFVCFGTALRDSAAENPLNRICATWVLPN